MGKLLTLSAIACVAMFALFSCSKSGTSSLPLSSSSYTMSATITKSPAVTLFSASSPMYVTALNNNHVCNISGSDTSGGSVISNFTTKADYESSGTAFSQTSFANCTIIITNISGENIFGTFYGTLTDGSVVTNGKFTALGNGF